MKQPIEALNATDDDGFPAGGWVYAKGTTINWQNGPLGRGEDRQEPNGAFVETVIEAARQRLEWYQTVSGGRFACEENQCAILLLDAAIGYLDQRTRKREERQVEGTHEA